VTTIDQIERLLQTYDFQDIIDINGLTEEEVLYFLVEQEFVSLPEVKPVDYND
jgi:hypothetical protein